jgi:hypothetical protein
LTIIFAPTKHRKISKSFYAETNGAFVRNQHFVTPLSRQMAIFLSSGHVYN